MSLEQYRRKRHFGKTSEPEGGPLVKGSGQYLIQKHDASRLHYDFRLELDGVLKSWAVPKGPSLDPTKKSLAVHVEDHPLEYGSFEGVIPQGEYGGGTVMLWDRGTWESEGDAPESYRRGKLVFLLNGERLKGRWALIRMGGKAGQDGKNWLLKKVDDEEARSGDDDDILSRFTTSVATGRTMEQIANNMKPVKKSAEKIRRLGAARPQGPYTERAQSPRPFQIGGSETSGNAGESFARAPYIGGEDPPGNGMAPRAEARRLPDDRLCTRPQGVALHAPRARLDASFPDDRRRSPRAGCQERDL